MEIYLNELTTESPYELPKNMKFIQELEQGAFGKVILVRENIKNIDLAIKVINKIGAGIQTIKKMKEEISILKKLHHENIVKFYGYIETNSQLLIEMEYIKYGTLGKWIKENRNISEKEASLLLGRVLSAIEYLHNQHICHRDIKPENIMFSKKNDFESVKIIDFGLSAQHFNYLYNSEYCGTFIYMAPEQLEKKLYYYSVDIWSIGILMYMLLNNGKHPFYQNGEKLEDFSEKIKKGKIEFINKVSYMAKNLIYKLCEPNPSWRYSAALAIKHPWITRNPKDDIPLTFNEILVKNNNKKNAIALMMINIFLNYAKKNAMKNNLIKKRKNNKIFKINSDYINQCEIFGKEDRERNEKFRERCLEVLSTDEEDSFEKKKNVHINKKKYSTTINTPKSYFEVSTKNGNINVKSIKRINHLHKNSMEVKKNILNKFDKLSKIDKRKRLSLSRLLSFPNKNKKLEEIKKEEKIDNNEPNLNKHLSYKSNKKFNSNKLISNGNNKNRLYYQKQKSSSKFSVMNINTNSIDNKNVNSDLINNLDKTPKKNKMALKINKFKLKTNFPYVSKLENNFTNTSNKKCYIFTRNFNITPLVLPFIGVKG
jgi:serine/threonine protein kinase